MLLWDSLDLCLEDKNYFLNQEKLKLNLLLHQRNHFMQTLPQSFLMMNNWILVMSQNEGKRLLRIIVKIFLHPAPDYEC